MDRSEPEDRGAGALDGHRALPFGKRLPVRAPVNGRRRHFDAGMVIYSQGEDGDAWLLLEAGVVMTCRYGIDGHRHVTRFAVAGDVVGIDVGMRAETASALTPVMLSPLVCDSGGGGEGAADFMQMVLQKTLAELQDSQALLARRTAVERVAAFLLLFGARTGHISHVELPMSRADLADHLGLGMHTISRAFSQLLRSRFIALADPHHVRLLQRGQLANLAGVDDDFRGDGGLRSPLVA
ncbi:MAG: helix-turn-helix domain-containing protein [Sphingomonadales bacterium]|nr:helix-turn-helix domain-containing protein [Sphingomonadales bacterium]